MRKKRQIKPHRLSKDQRAIIDIYLSIRKPETEKEKALAKEIEDIKKKGRSLDLPFE